MKRFSFVLLAFGLVAAVGSRAGEISQKSNTQDRSFERLPDLNWSAGLI